MIEVYIARMGIFDLCAAVTLTLAQWPSYINLTRTPCRYTGCAHMNLLHQAFQKLLSDRYTDKQTRQRWRSHHSICCSQKPHATCKPNRSIYYRTKVMDNQSLHCGNMHVWCFRLLWPWLRPSYTNLTRIAWRNSTQHITSYVKAFESYDLTERHTYRQNRPKL